MRSLRSSLARDIAKISSHVSAINRSTSATSTETLVRDSPIASDTFGLAVSPFTRARRFRCRPRSSRRLHSTSRRRRFAACARFRSFRHSGEHTLCRFPADLCGRYQSRHTVHR